ncbi:MAG: hypothetical protein EPO18_18825 [Methylobacter sp.]|nr:MAG: hypothetical protein EPO18_18825 [Methylobacter sp.]
MNSFMQGNGAGELNELLAILGYSSGFIGKKGRSGESRGMNSLPFPVAMRAACYKTADLPG